MALTGKTISELTYLSVATNDTLYPVELSGSTYHVPFSGMTGVAGTSGSSGTSGADGTSGSSGTNGTSGSSGSSGNSGADGTSGSSGTSGVDGTSGSSGSSGTSGTSGVDGTSGTSGADGTSGSSGTSGADGTSGSSGTSGADGTSGSSGTSGADGTSGSSGTSGADGTSGSSGTSGADGTSGSSGTSGADGTSGSSGISPSLSPYNGNIDLNGDLIFSGDGTVTTDGGDLILHTNLATGSTGTIRIYDGANGDIFITPNGSGLIKTSNSSRGGLYTRSIITQTNGTNYNIVWDGVASTIPQFTHSAGVFTNTSSQIRTFNFNLMCAVSATTSTFTEADIWFSENGTFSGTNRRGQVAQLGSLSTAMLSTSWTFILASGGTVRCYVYANQNYGIGIPAFGITEGYSCYLQVAEII